MPSAFASSEFVDLFTEVSADLGEEITLHGDTDVFITALVDPIEELSSDDEPAEFRTRFYIATSKAGVIDGIKEVSFFGARWHLLEPYPVKQGMLSVPCMRRYDENIKSQIFDIKHDQADWHD